MVGYWAEEWDERMDYLMAELMVVMMAALMDIVLVEWMVAPSVDSMVCMMAG